MLLLWRSELTREVEPWQAITDRWRTKVRATMERLEAEADVLTSAPFGVGQIAVICAQGQLDFRWGDSAWRDSFPRLAAAGAMWAERPSVKATAVVDDLPQNEGVTVGQLGFLL